MARAPEYYQNMTMGGQPPPRDVWRNWSQEEKDRSGFSTCGDIQPYYQAWQKESRERNVREEPQNKDIARAMLNMGGATPQNLKRALSQFGIHNIHEEGQSRYRALMQTLEQGGESALMNMLAPGSPGAQESLTSALGTGRSADEGYDQKSGMFFNWRPDGSVDLKDKWGLRVKPGSRRHRQAMNSLKDRGITDKASMYEKGQDAGITWNVESWKKHGEQEGEVDPNRATSYRGVGGEDETEPQPYAAMPSVGPLGQPGSSTAPGAPPPGGMQSVGQPQPLGQPQMQGGQGVWGQAPQPQALGQPGAGGMQTGGLDPAQGAPSVMGETPQQRRRKRRATMGSMIPGQSSMGAFSSAAPGVGVI